MDGAVDGLILRGEECLDLVVGLVDGAGAAGFLVAFAAELERHFGKRFFFVSRGRSGVAVGPPF